MKSFWTALSDVFFPPKDREPTEYVPDSSKTNGKVTLFLIIIVIGILGLSYLLISFL